jgi:adenylate kinase
VPGIDDDDGGELVQRKDDTLEVVRERLATYDEKTAPLIEYYDRAGLLVHVDALKPIDAVTASILAAVESRAKATHP